MDPPRQRRTCKRDRRGSVGEGQRYTRKELIRARDLALPTPRAREKRPPEPRRSRRQRRRKHPAVLRRGRTHFRSGADAPLIASRLAEAALSRATASLDPAGDLITPLRMAGRRTGRERPPSDASPARRSLVYLAGTWRSAQAWRRFGHENATPKRDRGHADDLPRAAFSACGAACEAGTETRRNARTGVCCQRSYARPARTLANRRPWTTITEGLGWVAR